jgi:GTP cyclohydrolase FolE2
MEVRMQKKGSKRGEKVYIRCFHVHTINESIHQHGAYPEVRSAAGASCHQSITVIEMVL